MVVHLGVVVMALAIVTSTSYTTRNEVTLATGQSTVVSGQYVTFHGFHTVKDSLETATQLRVDVNHHALLPAITTYNGRSAQPVGTPAIDSNLVARRLRHLRRRGRQRRGVGRPGRGQPPGRLGRARRDRRAAARVALDRWTPARASVRRCPSSVDDTATRWTREADRHVRLGGGAWRVVIALSAFLATRHPVSDATVAPSPLLGKSAPAISGTRTRRRHASRSRANAGTSSSSTSGRRGVDRASRRRRNSRPTPGTSARRASSWSGWSSTTPCRPRRAFAAHYGSLYPSIVDPGGTIANGYGVTSPPTTFVIDRHGRVAATLLGATTAKQLAAVVKRVSS